MPHTKRARQAIDANRRPNSKQLMTLKDYIAELHHQYQTGVAREHTYRPALQNLLATMLPHLTVSNEPARQACGAPDFILQRKGSNIPISFVEAKDLDDGDLGGKKSNKEQFDRYKRSLDSIMFTDYLDFWLYEKGALVDSARIARIDGKKVVAVSEGVEKFQHLVARLGAAQAQKITSSATLARVMAGKARLLADVIEKSLTEGNGDSSLNAQLEAFKDILIHTITPKEFADVYAQTIAYGMFAARLHDRSHGTFSREEAAVLIPKTNPFLRKLFQYIAGYDLDMRISWVVDDLAQAFRTADMAAVMSGFGKRTQQTDPMIHFYEDFLAAYDPALRKSRGVWYTPQPVVSFIVRAVDRLLQRDFGLPMGLADTSTTKLRLADPKGGKPTEVDAHRVQLLDPAAGTGTFLAEAVSCIHRKFEGQGGMWQSYVEQHLIPRLNGFELLMASYTMAHLKLDLLLAETGFTHGEGERLRVFLTNSLEEYSAESHKLGFYKWLSDEANEADRIKRDTPVMVVLGNPPYSGESGNKGDWILRLMQDYKKEPDKGIQLQERNAKWLNDDYCKFIRLGQYFVDKNAEGILAYINNHSFIDNPTFRGMRWNLMKSFDKLYIIDLHGNSKKKERCPDCSKDENVFDIQQGVSINLFIKTGKKIPNELAEVYHYDLWGSRDDKYSYLLKNSFDRIPFAKLQPTSPEYFFVPKNFEMKEEYTKGFSVNELMPTNSVGIVTSNDKVLVSSSKQELLSLVSNYYSITADEKAVKRISYRPFDNQYVYYDTTLIERSREKVMRNFLVDENVGLVLGKQCVEDWKYVFITKNICVFNLTGTAGSFGSGTTFPLYLYPKQADLLGSGRRPNLDAKLVKRFAETVGLAFEPEKSGSADTFAPIDLLDYIYAILHSPAYRKRYGELLKIDFPHVPYPQGATEAERAERFRGLAAIGAQLRLLHLMEHPALAELTTRYPVAGDSVVEKLRWEPAEGSQQGRVWINAKQYFEGVPSVAWTHYIGGYQPAQKWLKDRVGQTLSYDDIMHYQRIVKALTMTAALMTDPLLNGEIPYEC